MDDIRLAMLGDKAAQERMTERGQLLPCHRCKGEATMYKRDETKTSSIVCFWHIKCKECKYELDGYGTEYEIDSYGNPQIKDGFDGRKKTIKRWNTRAPILTPEELEKLEELQ